jgi:hypothetical protein
MMFGRVPRVAAWSAILFATVGAVVLAVSGWVIAAWHLLVLATPSVGVPHLQYDTAWAFAFCGAALIAYALRLRRVGQLFAVAPVALGAIRLIAYLAPGTINIHPILGHPWLPFGAECSPRWCSSFWAARWHRSSRRRKVRGARFWSPNSRRRRLRLPC